uniref:39S ribosomal protein L17, mitochondrial-like n=1 Tax=Arvicanthis niloticus TaxID=61156 RepID=UPI001487077C|nr:39S ribosomal protein L17, mitochondrial-like [Arvicanthis niloticus]
MRLSLAAAISHGRVYRRLGLGPESRIHLLRNLLTGLVRHERIEATWARVDEMRGYAEKLIDYGKLGDTTNEPCVWLTSGHCECSLLLVKKESLDKPVSGRFKPGHSLTYQREGLDPEAIKVLAPRSKVRTGTTQECYRSRIGRSKIGPRWQ